MPELISLNDAAARGIERLRQSMWADPLAHLKIDIIDGQPGPWVHLFDPFNYECNGRDPVDVLWVACNPTPSPAAKIFEAYLGPLPDSDEYRARVAQHAKLSKEIADG